MASQQENEQTVVQLERVGLKHQAEIPGAWPEGNSGDFAVQLFSGW